MREMRWTVEDCSDLFGVPGPEKRCCLLREPHVDYGKGLAGACRDLLAPITETYLRDLPQFAYQPKRGLSDALGHVVRHVRLVRQSCQDARRTRHQIRQSQVRPPLVGGVCFALDLSQAFDMVSRRDLLDTLRAAGADSALIDLVAALHAESTYSFRAQGQEGQVVSTTGIKQGCKLAPTLFAMLTGTIFRELIALVGVQAVVDYLTGCADDLTVHREIHSMEDLGRAHALIEQLLALVRKHGFAVNPSKCTMMVKLEGTQAQQRACVGLLIGAPRPTDSVRRCGDWGRRSPTRAFLVSHHSSTWGYALVWQL